MEPWWISVRRNREQNFGRSWHCFMATMVHAIKGEELHQAFLQTVQEMEAGHPKLRQDSHEAFPEIEIERVFEELYRKKGVTLPLEHAVYTVSCSGFFPRSTCACMKAQGKCWKPEKAWEKDVSSVQCAENFYRI